MALTYGFYNSVEGDRKYDAIQMGQIFDGIITDGIYATFLKAMVVKASENASEVIVQPGRCWFNHTWTYIDADYPVTAPAPEVILDRVDALVLDINSENAFRENSLIWVQGTPSSLNPERPSLIKSVTHNQYPLCYVYRKAGTTMIYAADITNAVGTSETPFVTGVLTGINIDDLLAQWDDEFHTWEATTKTSFEAWMVNQQSVYVTWFDSIKDQMEGDLTDFEAWFETIRGIIDEEAATHLQAEIDEIKGMLPAGSHIDVSTSEPTLFNRNVTVSDGVHSKTVQFDASGAATVKSFPYIGIIDVSSTDGERIASESINIPYFGRYSAVLAFWSATVSLLGDESLAALPVTVRDGNGDVVAIVTLNASGQGVFTATKPDTYKFIYTYGGQTMETTLQVTQETTYEVAIHGGFNYDGWLTAGRVSKTFTSLDDILADEETLRQLMLVHDAVDYLASETVNTDVEKIFNTDLAAKWINLSDYALDHFYAVAGIKSIMDTADKYGYGEWVITDDTTTPPTWGPKGNVPVMTSNTAPYGTVIASRAVSGYEAYRAFDRNYSDSWAPVNTTAATTDYVGFKFTNPICPKKATIRRGGATYTQSFIIEASNDNSTWTSISDTISLLSNELSKDILLDTNSFYLYLRLRHLSTGGTYITSIAFLQFYGRELKVSVPTMTSNTAPYGEAIGGTTTSSSVYPYNAFDGVYGNDGWRAPINDAWVGYRFANKVKIYKVVMRNRGGAGSSDVGAPKDFILQGSNDGYTWIDVANFTNNNNNGDAITTYDNANSEAVYNFYRLYITTRYTSSGNWTWISELQFYGLDYSEKEFEAGATKKWLYDHGVELVSFTKTKGSSTTSVDPTNDGSEIYWAPLNGSTGNDNNFNFIGSTIDLTNYSIERVIYGSKLVVGTTYAFNLRVWDSMPSGSITGAGALASKDVSCPVSNPNTEGYLNISSVNGSKAVTVGTLYYNGRVGSVKEWWLE